MEYNETALREQPLYLNKLLMTCLVTLEQVKLFRCKICDKLYCHNESLTTHMTTHAKEGELSPPMRMPANNKCSTYAILDCSKQHVQNANRSNNNNKKLTEISYGEKVIKPGSSVSLRDRIIFEDDNEDIDNDGFSIMPINDTESTDILQAYTCRICNEQFGHKSTLSIHISKHLGKVLFTCDVCGLEFNLKRKLNEHKISHSSETPYNCELCQRSFKHKQQLKIHIQRNHSNTHKSLKCEMCDKSYKYLNELKRHLRTHTGEKLFHCEICNISFRTYSSINYHMNKVHTPKENWLKCDLCEMSLVNKSTLEKHILGHMTTGYQCRVCKRECGHPVSLARHLKRHSEKNLRCRFCKKWFEYTYYRERHEKTHHIKCFDFECPMCKRKFGRKDHVQRHMIKSCPQRNKES